MKTHLKIITNITSSLQSSKLILIICTFLFMVYNSKAQSSSELNSQLFIAIKKNDLQQTKKLIKNGANVNATDKNGATPLMWSAYSSDFKIFKHLIDKGAQFDKKGIIWNYKDNKKAGYYGNILHIAAAKQKLPILKYLIEKCGMDINSQTSLDSLGNIGHQFFTPLHAVCCFGNDSSMNTVNYLLNEGADYKLSDNSGTTLLHAAAYGGNIEFLKLFISKGLNINSKNNYGSTPLDLASFNNQLKTSLWLINNGASVNFADDPGLTDFHYICWLGDFKTVHSMLKNKKNPNISSTTGIKPIHTAALNGKTNITKLLYLYGADLYAEMDNGNTLFDIASNNYNNDLIDFYANPPSKLFLMLDLNLLEEFKEKIKTEPGLINIKSEGKSLLHHAVNNQQYPIIKFLLNNGIDVNSTDKNRQTPLDYAAKIGDIKSAEILINEYKEKGQRDNAIYNAMFKAINKGHLLMVKLLHLYGANTKEIGQSYNENTKNNYVDLFLFEQDPDLFIMIDLGKEKEAINYLKKKPEEIKLTNKLKTILHYAASNRFYDLANFYIKHLASGINLTDYMGRTALFSAIDKGDIQMIKLLLRNGININKADKSEITPLILALDKSKVEIAKLLIDNGAELNETNSRGLRPIHYSIKCRNLNLFKIIENKSSVKFEPRDENFCLAYATQLNATEIVDYMISKGAQTNTTFGNRNSILIIASGLGYSKIVNMLISNKARLNVYGEQDLTPLIAATKFGNGEIAKSLIEKGANVNMFRNNSALHFAIENKDLDLVKYLLNNNANINCKNKNGDTPLFTAIDTKDTSLIKLLLNKGAEINHQNLQGNTPLLLALNNGLKKISKELIIKGADVNIANYNSLTPAFLVLNKEYTDIFITLINKGAKLSGTTTDKKRGALHMAAENKYAKLTKYLLEKSFDPNQPDTNNITPLMLAAGRQNKIEMTFNVNNNPLFKDLQAGTFKMNENTDIVKLMYIFNADLSLKDNTGKKAIDYAKEQDNMEIFDFLKNPEHRIFVAMEYGYEDKVLEMVKTNKTLTKIVNQNGQNILDLAIYYDYQNLIKYLKNLKAKTQVLQNDNNNKPVKLLLPIGHTDKINEICISLDNKHIATCSKDKSVIVWDIASKKALIKFTDHKDEVNTLKFSNDDKHIFSGSEDGTINAYNLKTGLKTKTYKNLIKDNEFKIKNLIFSNDNEHFYSLNTSNKIYKWNLRKIQPILELKVKDSGITAFAEFKNGLIASLKDSTICLIDKNNGTITKSLYKNKSESKEISISKDDKYVLLLNSDSSLILSDISFNKIRRINTNGLKNITAKFIPDSGKIVTINNDSTITVLKINDILNQSNNLVNTRKIIHTNVQYEQITFSKNSQYFALTHNNIIEFWNTDFFSNNDYSHKNVRIFKNHTNNIDFSTFNIETKKMAFGSKNDIKIWNIETTSPIQPINIHNKEIHTVSFSDDGTLLSSGGFDRYINIYNAKENKQIGRIKELSGGIKHLKFSYDNQLLMSGNRFNQVSLWNLTNNENLTTFKASETTLFDAKLSPDKKFIVISSMNNTLSVLDINTGITIKKIVGHNGIVNSVNYSKDGKIILSASEDRTMKLWNNDGEEIKTLNGFEYGINNACLTPDNKKVLARSTNNLVIIDIETENIIYDYVKSSKKQNNVKDYLTQFISSVAGSRKKNVSIFLQDLDKVLASTNKNFFEIHSIQQQKVVLKLIPVGKKDWIIVAPDNYYTCTKGALEKMGWKKNNKAFNFEQFDIKYNRPDIIFERLGFSSNEKISLYKKAYKKRLKKLNIREDMLSEDFNVPEIEIVNKDSIPYHVSEQKISLTINAKDSKHKLDRINIWVNNIPIYGINGIDLRPVQTGRDLPIMRKISIPLSKGENKIDISVLNQAGAESLKQTLYINYTPKEITKPNLYVVAIGISEYQNNHFNLNYAAKDANDLCSEFLNKKEQFGAVKIIKLLDKKATAEKIQAIKDTLMQSDIEDEVVVFFAGHGLLDENLDYYLALSNMDFDKPSEFGLPYEELENLLDGIPARKKLLLIDACHSGEVDKEEGSEIEIVSENTNTKDKVVHRGVSPLGFKKKKKKVGLKNSFELMKELFADLRRGTGAMVISSAGGGEFAFEGEQWKNGVFTYSVIQALRTSKPDKNKDGIVQVSELRDFVQDMVKKLTNGKQNPTSRRENLEFDFGVW